MLLLVGEETNTLSYWLNWRVFLCAVWVVAPMIAASFIIWKYECSGNSESNGRRTQQESSLVHYDKSWKPCIKGIHPIFLMVFRMIAFSLLLVALIFDLAIHGAELFYYYTQWTFTLVTIYFGLASLLSVHGCYYHHKKNSNSGFNSSGDMEQGLYVPLAHDVNKNGVKLVDKPDRPGKLHVVLTSGFWDNLLQVLYQMTAGAVTLTDVVYWCMIFPYCVVTHSLNGILLLGDTAMNCLPFPMVPVFLLRSVDGWPYPFLDLSAPHAPMWYLAVAVMHIPCYSIYLLVVKVKHFILSRWFHISYSPYGLTAATLFQENHTIHRQISAKYHRLHDGFVCGENCDKYGRIKDLPSF